MGRLIWDDFDRDELALILDCLQLNSDIGKHVHKGMLPFVSTLTIYIALAKAEANTPLAWTDAIARIHKIRHTLLKTALAQQKEREHDAGLQNTGGTN